MSCRINFPAGEASFALLGREITIHPQDSKTLNDSLWLTFRAKGFETEDSGREFGESLRAFLLIFGASNALSFDLGNDKSTSRFSTQVIDACEASKPGSKFSSNIHGLSVHSESYAWRFGDVSATGYGFGAGWVDGRDGRFEWQGREFHTTELSELIPGVHQGTLVGDFVAAVQGEGLAGLEERVESFAGAGRAGYLGTFGGFVMQGGDLHVDNAVEPESGEREAAGEDALHFILWIEVSGEVGVEGVEFLGGFGGEAHVRGQETVADVVEAGMRLALNVDGSGGVRTFRDGWNFRHEGWFGERRWIRHCAFIVPDETRAGGWGRR